MVGYASPVDDVVFQANGTSKEPIPYKTQHLYLPDLTARLIACADQHEFCIPTTGQCSGLSGILGQMNLFFGDNARQKATMLRIQHHAEMYTIERSVKTLGSQGTKPREEFRRHCALEALELTQYD